MRLAKVIVAAVAVAVLVGAKVRAADPKFTVDDKTAPRFTVVENKLADLESRVAKLEAVKAPAVAPDCPCPDGGRCVCGATCPCAAKATPPAATEYEEWVWQGRSYMIPRGKQIPGGYKVAAAPTAAAWDCNSGVCRPASGVTYGAASGSCAGGSCGAPYGGVYGGYSFPGQFVGAGMSSGGCSGGSCGSPSAGGVGFRRR